MWEREQSASRVVSCLIVVLNAAASFGVISVDDGGRQIKIAECAIMTLLAQHLHAAITAGKPNRHTCNSSTTTRAAEAECEQCNAFIAGIEHCTLFGVL